LVSSGKVALRQRAAALTRAGNPASVSASSLIVTTSFLFQ
jgi:hypothetical protein